MEITAPPTKFLTVPTAPDHAGVSAAHVRMLVQGALDPVRADRR
jgi:hypothetical protein